MLPDFPNTAPCEKPQLDGETREIVGDRKGSDWTFNLSKTQRLGVLKYFCGSFTPGACNPRPLLLVRNFEEVALCVSLKMRALSVTE